jgi:hypothetical protein
MPYALATCGDLFDRPRHMEQLLGEATACLPSTTFLRDVSELTPLLRKLKRPHNCHHRLLDYRQDERTTLLEEQRQISAGTPLQCWLFDRLNAFVDKRLVNDLERYLPSVCRPAEFKGAGGPDQRIVPVMRH